MRAIVHIVDDDQSVRQSLKWLLDSVGLDTVLYENGQAFLNSDARSSPGCVLLDVRMPLLGGFELQAAMKGQQNFLPIIFLTAHGTIPMTVEALKKGAFDFLEKPYNDQILIDKVNSALSYSVSSFEVNCSLMHSQRQLSLLSPREQEVLAQLVEGKSSKVIARELDISFKTVEAHRAHIREKLGVSSIAELVNFVAAGGSRLPLRRASSAS